MSNHDGILEKAALAKYSYVMAGLRSLADEIGEVRKSYKRAPNDPANALAIEVENLVRALYDQARALKPEQFDSVPVEPDAPPENNDEDLLA